MKVEVINWRITSSIERKCNKWLSSIYSFCFCINLKCKMHTKAIVKFLFNSTNNVSILLKITCTLCKYLVSKVLVSRYIFEWKHKWRECDYFLDSLFHETFPHFCYRSSNNTYNIRAANKSKSLRCSLVIPVGYVSKKKFPNGRWRHESPFGTFWTQNLEIEGKNSSKRCAMVSVI